MLYAERDESGEIKAIHNSPVTEGQESLSDEELISFFSQSGDTASYQTLLSLMDIKLVRVIDDLIELLVAKNIIRFTDLPEQARKKLGQRKQVRKKMQESNPLMVDDII